MTLLLLLVCADPEPAACDAGFGYVPGCEAPEGYVLPDPDTCYTGCAGPDDPVCDAGTTCAEAWVDPCAGGDCGACGGTTWLCVAD